MTATSERPTTEVPANPFVETPERAALRASVAALAARFGLGVAVGVAGLFMETHPKPAEAWSDGPNAVPLGRMKALLETLVALDSVTKTNPLLENDFQ